MNNKVMKTVSIVLVIAMILSVAAMIVAIVLQ